MTWRKTYVIDEILALSTSLSTILVHTSISFYEFNGVLTSGEVCSSAFSILEHLVGLTDFNYLILHESAVLQKLLAGQA